MANHEVETLKRRCKKCNMIRAKKDLVHFKDGTYMCFSCWNKIHNRNEK